MKGVVLGLAGMGALFGVLVWACGSPNSHIFIARPYELARDCVDPSEGVDVVDGPAPGGSCTPVCVIDPMRDYFVSGNCPPYPFHDSIETSDAAMDPTCVLALAAYARNDTCYPDGGSSHPATSDAGGGPVGDATGE